MANNLSPDSENYIKQAVQKGIYENETEALEQAVSLLKKRDQLRSDVEAGIREADGGELLPADQVFERLTARARQIETAAQTDE